MAETETSELVRISPSEYIYAACKGMLPRSLLKLFESLESATGRDIFRIAYAIGALQPLSAIRPDASELRMVFDKTVTIPAGVFAADGKTVIPGEAKLIRICGPEGKAMMVDTLRALPVDLNGVNNGSLKFKRLAVSGFSEGFCPAGEPADGDDVGTYQNVEHIFLQPGGGFDLYGENFSTSGTAMIHVSAVMWAAC